MSDQVSPNEILKKSSNYLRGTIQDGLQDEATGAFSADDTQLTKFHGFYQQDDRDERAEREDQKLEPFYSMMLRARLPGGVVTPQQWLRIDELAGMYTEYGSVRLTTRQTFQYHGILKKNIKNVIRELYTGLIDSIAACGDVNRNVLAASNPNQSGLHKEAYEWAKKISEHLLPNTRAYFELFLDEEKVASTEQEPVYGDTYLPRKFKTAVAVPPDNDTDVYANDMGFIAVAENGKLKGFNVTAGGGMGMTHGDSSTYPQTAKTLGYIEAADTLKTAEAILTVQRDFGDRLNRKQARLKYTIDRMGPEAFRKEVEKRAGLKFAEPVPVIFRGHSDRYGWLKGTDGKWYLTLFIENGRIADANGKEFRTGLREIAKIHKGTFRITANQNLIVAETDESEKDKIDRLAARYGLKADSHSKLRLNSMACVALPTCGLAMAESERYLPGLISKTDDLLSECGLKDEEIVVRMTGCPNGCARPFLAELAFVGKGPGKYNMYLGGDGTGTRLNQLYRENIGEAEILSVLKNLFEKYAKERNQGERFGDFTVRAGFVKEVKDGRQFHAV